jgi:hypothetical protein
LSSAGFIICACTQLVNHCLACITHRLRHDVARHFAVPACDLPKRVPEKVVVLQALSEPTRLALLNHARRRAAVGELAQLTGFTTPTCRATWRC